MDYQQTRTHCPKCNNYLYWRDCDRCDGTGYRHRDMDTEPCQWCEGECGTWWCETCHRFVDSETVRNDG